MVFCEEENASFEAKADRKEARSLPYKMFSSEITFQNYGKVIKYFMLKSNFGLARKTIIKYF
jgi:hypothetical protein